MNDVVDSMPSAFSCGDLVGSFGAGSSGVPDWSLLPSVGVVVFAGGPEAYLVEVAERWARVVCPTSFAVDVHVVAPAGPSWTVGELDDLVITPASLAPEAQHVFVVARADSVPYVDRLLKVLEEPPAATLWVLCVADVEALKPTVRSRAVAVVELRAGPSPALVASLEAAGVDAGRVLAVFSQVVELLNDIAAVAPVELGAVSDAFVSAVASPSVLSAAVLSNSLDALFSAAGCDTPVRRRLQRACLSSFHAALARRLEGALRAGSDPSAAGWAADVFYRSEVAVAAHAKLGTHLAASSLAARDALSG